MRKISRCSCASTKVIYLDSLHRSALTKKHRLIVLSLHASLTLEECNESVIRHMESALFASHFRRGLDD